MSARISQQQLEAYLWGAATLLRGTIDAGDYKQFIFPLLFYKRVCDVFDEETQAALKESGGDAEFAQYPENHRFQIPSDAHWRNVRQKATNVGRAIQEGMRAIETANQDKLFGIFGDAQWTNKDRLSDPMLRDLVEHFSKLNLALGNLPEDELGQGYEYLIKKFADDAGHTAAEFYTNRTVVHLMTEMLNPEPGESIYDPTCGSGGMLLSCITHLRRQGKEWRNVRLYGQERNLMTSSIARMNCFLHGIEDFRIERGDTLSEPKFVRGDRLMQFDVVLANPPYSIKQWARDAFASDPWGRNLYGTPPQGRADYAFWQHILCSLKAKSGRCAILFPHGVLFRQEEADMRRKLIEADLIECVLGLGPNLFYNSPMEACVVICRTGKPKGRKGRILFINAVNEVTRERAQSFLTGDHIEHIVKTYEQFANEPGFARVATLEEIRQQGGSLNLPMYVASLNTPGAIGANADSIAESLAAWLKSGAELRALLDAVLGGKLKPSGLPASITAGTPPAWLTRREWTRLPFGAFADSVNERVEPADAAEAVYVGLDDLDPGSLHIRRSGMGSDVIGTKLRFRQGDIIFGRRRAYQRKLAVAELDGICSAHAMVVRAKPDVVLPALLPFLMMSDRFMKRAVEISVGSLSPTINWTALRLEEFDLPPIDLQERIAAMLWAVDDAASATLRLEADAAALKVRVADEAFDQLRAEAGPEYVGGDDAKKVITLSVADVLADGKSLTYGILQPGADDPDGIPMLRAIDIEDGELSGTRVLRVAREVEAGYERTRLQGCEVLLSVMGTVGRTIMVRPEWIGWNVNRALAVIRLGDRVLPEFFYCWLRSPQMQAQMSRDSIGTAQLRINLSHFKTYVLPVPPLKRQAEVVARIRDAEDAHKKVAQAATQTAALTQLLVDTVFGARDELHRV